ncbi:hypothetical protein AB0F17_31425 [Nonomuraea sp. NPDC026600]|uniref:hypothetical protein n=1 Tax=Nonomuraea sp. NPDC026600 TaxID=3155363 RepID=UPI0033CF5C1D
MAEDKKIKVKQQTHMIKTYCPTFGVDDDGRSVAEVKTFVQSLDATAVKQAGNAYLDACSTLAGAQRVIEDINVEMAKCWDGKASVEAQEALRVLHATVRELSGKLNWMGRPLQSLGDRIQEHQEFMDKGGMSWADNTFTFDDSSVGWFRTMDKGMEWGSQDELAGKHLRLLNDDLTQTYQNLPDSFHKEIPDIKDPDGLPPPVTPLNTDFSNPGGTNGLGNGGYNGAGYNDGSSDGSDKSGGVTDPTGGVTDPTKGLTDPTKGATDPTTGATDPTNGAKDPTNGATDPTKGVTDPTNGVTDPTKGGLTDPTKGMTDPTSGINDPTKGSLASPTSTKLEDFQPPADWNPGNTPNSTPTSTNTNPNLTSPSSPNSSTPATGPLTSAGGGGMASGLSNGLGSAKAGSGMGSGMPFMPMGGGGAGAEERTNEGGTWLTEDDDVWGGETEGVVNDRIG